MFQSQHVKPDGRQLWLYGRELIALHSSRIPVPDDASLSVASHLRWHPLAGEWVIQAGHRQHRPVSTGACLNPLAPSTDRDPPTELPAGNWEVAVFENRFPSLIPSSDVPEPVAGANTAAATGRCEVVVFAQEETASLGQLGAERVALVLRVLAQRTVTLAREGLAYVLPFENRGAEMGVTLAHPHGQIYGYGFLPAVQARALDFQLAYLKRAGEDFVTALARSEERIGTRMIAAKAQAMSFVPPFARFPYETWIVPRRHVEGLASLSESELLEVAYLVCDALRRLDGLFDKPMPYLMTINQAPTDGAPHPEWTMRIEIWPIRRSASKLKYLAGTELGAGVFACDVSPETAAAELRKIAQLRKATP